MKNLLDVAKQAVELAKKKGATEAGASAYRERSVSVGWRDGKVEKISESTERGLGLQLYSSGRYLYASTSDLRPEALEKFVEDNLAMVKALQPDPARALPDAKYYEHRSSVDLGIVDKDYSSFSPELRKKKAKELEDSARSVKGASAILSVSTSVSDYHSQSAKVLSNGFEGEKEETSYWLSADVSCKDNDGRRPEAYDSAGSRRWQTLVSPTEVGKTAAERALGSLGAKKIESSILPIVIENRVAARVVRALLGAMTGRALQQKQSFLEGLMGKTFGSKLMTITDDPLLPGGYSSRLYDGEGLTAKKLPIFEAGVLKNYYVDVYYGRKLKMDPTTASSSNLVFSLGKQSLEQMCKEAKEAILITGFLGGNSNSTTGDYSLGIQGFRVRNGVKAEPISEMNISGNQKTLWSKLSAVGNDPYPHSSVRIPSLMFDAVQIAGK